MRTKTINVYSFAELSDKAKERAKQSYAADCGYRWADEALKSMNALAEHFGGAVKDWSIDFFASSYSSMDFDMPDDMTAKEIRARLRELGTYDSKTLRGHGDCKLTGFCIDEDAVDGFRIAFVREKERDLGKLMRAAFVNWLKACQTDCDDEYSDEQLSEHCDANNYEFHANGDIA